MGTKFRKIFGKKKNELNSDIFTLGEEIVEHTSSYCYLGIVFDENGSFKTAINELRKKSLRALFGMRKYIIKQELSIKSLFQLFDCLIKPVFLYGCQVLSASSDLIKYLGSDICGSQSSEQFMKKIGTDPYEKFHLKYLKWCLSVHYKASNIGCWGDTGRHPLGFDALKLCVDYYERVGASEPTT